MSNKTYHIKPSVDYRKAKSDWATTVIAFIIIFGIMLPYSWPASSSAYRSNRMETVTTNLVRCDRPSCLNPVPAAEAVWYIDHDIAYRSHECEQADSEFRAALEPLEITHKRLDCVYNLSLCCIAPIDDWGRCSKCNKWACSGAVI